MNVKFSPADVVRRYQETGTQVMTGQLGVTPRDGVWCPINGCCCALGVMLIGRPSPVEYDADGSHDKYIAETFDINYEAFYDGFDNQLFKHVDGTNMQHPDNALGFACRKAVEEAGLYPARVIL